MSKRLLLGAFVVLGGLFFTSGQAHAFGLSPALTKVDGMLTSQQVERTMMLFRSDADQDGHKFGLILEGNGAEYLSFAEKVIEFEEGATAYELPFLIDTTLALPGSYKAMVSFEPLDTSGRGNGAFFLQTRIQIAVEFTVIEETVSNLEFTRFNMFLTQNKPVVELEWANNGNVPKYVSYVEVAASSPDLGVDVFFEKIYPDDGLMAPYELGAFRLESGRTLPDGDFNVVVRAFDDNALQISENYMKLSVVDQAFKKHRDRFTYVNLTIHRVFTATLLLCALATFAAFLYFVVLLEFKKVDMSRYTNVAPEVKSNDTTPPLS